MDDFVLGLIGGTINWLTNGAEFNMHGLAYFGVGFVSGALSEYISPWGSAALMGAGNNALSSYYSTGSVDPVAVVQGAATSVAFSLIGMGISSGLSPYISKFASKITNSPVLQGSITHGVVNTSIGAIGGGTMSLINGGNFWEGAWHGALWAGGIGFTTGAYYGYQVAKARGIDPWTGEDLNPITPMEPIKLSNVEFTDNKIKNIANRLKPGLQKPNEYPYNLNRSQEIRVFIEEGDFRLDFRVETHNRLDNVFKELNINKNDYIRHANIRFYQRIDGQWKSITVPGTQTKNYHIFLDYLNKYKK